MADPINDDPDYDAYEGEVDADWEAWREALDALNEVDQ